MKIACVSDMHGHLEHAAGGFPEADVLICAGDLVANVSRSVRQDIFLQRFELEAFNELLGRLPYKHKIVIAGNHDWALYRDEHAKNILTNCTYLQDSGVEIDGVKFWVSPWVPWFYDWAFMFHEWDKQKGGPEAQKKWAEIPVDTDVLITHGPAYGILDENPRGVLCGCKFLKDRLSEVKPKIHVFGHIHCSYGKAVCAGTTYINAALCDEMHNPVHPIQVVEIPTPPKAEEKKENVAAL